jgi:hypothetical protein
MKNFVLATLLFISSLQLASGQSGVKDSIIRFPFIGVSYGLYVPAGDLGDRFGNCSMISGNVLFKTTKNLLWGVSGGFFFSDNVKEPGLMNSLKNKDGYILGLDGLYADVRTYQRGYHVNFSIGKIFSWNKPNPNSGLIVVGGPGFMQHKIRIESIGNTVPALRNDYLKGYDRLTNGISLHEFVGYVYFSNRQLVNFYAGVEFVQAFTEGRRDYNFDQPETTYGKRTDLMFGVKLGWVIPLYKKKPAAYYFY